MRDKDKTKEQLLEELIALRNKVNSLQFETAQKDHKSALRAREESGLKEIRDYAAWVVYAAPSIMCQLSPEGMTRFINPFTETITGYRADELLGKNFWKVLFPGDEFNQVVKLYRQFEKNDVRDFDMALTTKLGYRRTFAMQSLNRRDDSGKITEVVIMDIDVSARKRVEEQLAYSEVKFRTLIENIPCAVYRYANDEMRTVKHMSDYIRQIAGHTAWDFIDSRILPYREIILPEDRPRVEEAIQAGVDARQSYIIEYRIEHADGNIRWVYEKGKPYFENKKLQWFDGMLFDITDRKEMQKKLEETLEKVRNLSLTDELTKLYNRRGFETHAEQQLRIAERNRRPVCILFVDLNKMKEINDNLGHEIGDKALVATAHVLNKTFRKADIVARLGGDEFAVLAVETDEKQARVMMGRLQGNVTEFNNESDMGFVLSMSVGIATYDPLNPCSIKDLLQRADERMYEMKKSTGSART